MDTTKIIKGAVSNGRYTVTAPIVKEDYGLYLQIEGVELPPTYQVDFSNSESNGTSVTMIGNSDGVLIPHQFIDTGKDIFAFLYHVGADFGRTVYKFRIPNKLRPDRTDEQPTPEEQSTIDQLIGAMNTAVAQTAQDVIDADASAQSASADADRAEEARTDAQNYATQAEQSATDAQESASQASNSATASANSASASAQIKADVEELVDDAQGYAESASQSATASANSATTAQGYAQSASSSAQSASDYASQAQTSANTASAKAQDASQSATTASQKATESAQSATSAQGYAQTAEQAKTASQTAQGLAESARDSAISAKNDAESARDDAESARDEAVQAVESISGALDDKADIITDTASGAVASFTDGADDLPLKSLVVNIDPVQDLHGYDSPWVAGGGKNKINAPDVTISSGSYLYNGALVLPAGTYTLSFTSSTGASTSASIAITDADGTAMVTGGHVIPYTFTLPNASANVKIYVSGAGTYTNIQIEEGSSATAYAPYENICPISGWTEVNVEHTEKNLLAKTFAFRPVPSSLSDCFFAKAGIYHFSFDGIGTATKWRFGISMFDAQGNALSGNDYKPNSNFNFIASVNMWYIGADVTIKSFSFTLQTDCYIRIWFGSGNTTASMTATNAQLEVGSSATPYEPYTGRSITINLGQTVYGGKVDVLSGVLTVDRAMAVFDGTETFRNNWFPTVVCAKAFPKGDALGNSFVNSHLPSLGVACDYATSGKTNFQFGKANEYWGVSSADELKTIFAQQYANGTPVTICYPLAEPIEIQLSANQINSLYGQNNIWADSGDTEVEYRADTKLFIERLTAPDSADMIADANITSGQYFMVGNSLYKATANIANGGQITVGTNCTRVSLAQALNEINA